VAPLDSDCSGNSISVLSLLQPIDISKAVFEGEDGGAMSCADLKKDQVVEVTLNDALLTASEIELAGSGWSGYQSKAKAGPKIAATKAGEGSWWSEDESEVKVTAPLITLNTATAPYTVSVLGGASTGAITVDISHAMTVNEDGQEILPTDLIVGQFVEMTLSSNAPPFTATVVKSLAPGSVVEFDVFDEHGSQIDDGSVDVFASVTVAKGTKKGIKMVTMHTTSNGKFRVANMPSGQAKVVVTRAKSGQKSKAANVVNVKRKSTKKVRVYLKRVP
jgi:hypothetical protein